MELIWWSLRGSDVGLFSFSSKSAYTWQNSHSNGLECSLEVKLSQGLSHRADLSQKLHRPDVGTEGSDAGSTTWSKRHREGRSVFPIAEPKDNALLSLCAVLLSVCPAYTDLLLSSFQSVTSTQTTRMPSCCTASARTTGPSPSARM